MGRTDIEKKCKKLWEAADTKRNAMSTVFKHLRDFARPSLESVGGILPVASDTEKSETPHTQLFDTTLVNAVNQHGGGVKAWMSPANSKWFSLKPHVSQSDNERAIVYWESVGQKLEELINTTNFHGEDFECILDGAALGTRALLIDTPSPNSAARNKPFVVRRWEPGLFSMLEDEDGFVSSVFITERYTAAQAVSKFGREKVPEAIATRFLTKPEDQTQDEYVLCIYPREVDEFNSQYITPDNLPIASNWFHKATGSLVRSSGHDEMPALVSRYLKWSGTPYGIPPAILALADARQLNRTQCSLDLLVDVIANPRLLVPVEQEGNISLEPGGVTFFGDPNRVPREWGSGGSYTEGDARVRMRRADIERALSLDVFRTFRNITKEITATEAVEIRAEAIDLFSPTFSLMSTEHYERVLERMLALCLRSGHLPPPPADLLEVGNSGPVVPSPKVQFCSRMALALANRHKAAIDESIQRRLGVANVLGEAAFDDIDLPAALRMIDRGNGLPTELHRKPEEVEQLQQARQQQQAMQQQMVMAEQAAKAAGHLKGTGMLPGEAAA